MKPDVAIAYRVYPGVSKTPVLHRDSKINLAHAGLLSLKKSLSHCRPKIFAILDGCPPEFEKMLKSVFPGTSAGLEIIRADRIGNAATFALQMKILAEQNFSENVYFAEDDYFYLPDSFHEMLNFLRTPGVDFITPYDHMDHYTTALHGYKSRLVFSGSRHWRDVGSTCMTFLTTRTVLKNAWKVLDTYSRGKDDSAMWFSLTKKDLFHLPRLAGLFFRHQGDFKHMKRAYTKKTGWKQVLFGRKYGLYCPVPGLATHLETGLLSPGIDWQAQFKRK